MAGQAGRLAAGVLLVPLFGVLLALWRPPFPIDETRYLAVAWEMHWRNAWLVPMLEGEPYVQKPPLLFWLIRLGWLLFDVNAWWPRLVVGLMGVATLWLTARLARELAKLADERPLPDNGWTAAALLAGFVAWPAWSVSLYFDVPLTFFVVAAAWAIVRLATVGQGGWLLALAAGGGALMKGPLVAFPLLGVVLGIPWWASHLPPHERWRRLLRVVGWGAAGALFPLAWLIAVAAEAGNETVRAILVAQGLGRVGTEADHAAPWWWYLPLIPFLLWPAGWRRSFWRGIGQTVQEPLGRFVLVAVVPALLLLSMIASKRAQYLLPLLPFLAILGGRGGFLVWQRKEPDVAPAVRSFTAGAGEAALLLVVGLLLMVAPFVPPWQEAIAWLTWRWVVVGVGLWFIAWGYYRLMACGILREGRGATRCAWLSQPIIAPMLLAWGVILWVSITALWASGDAFAVRPLADRITQWVDEGRPVVWVGGRHHAAWHFAARLKQPLPTINAQQLNEWLAHHQGGVALVTVKTRQQTTDGCLPWRSDWICPVRAKDHA